MITRAADFEPGDDGELPGWMGDEVSGVAGYAEALIDLYESCTAGIGLDPVAMTALHDVADAAAHAAGVPGQVIAQHVADGLGQPFRVQDHEVLQPFIGAVVDDLAQIMHQRGKRAGFRARRPGGAGTKR